MAIAEIMVDGGAQNTADAAQDLTSVVAREILGNSEILRKSFALRFCRGSLHEKSVMKFRNVTLKMLL